MKEQRKVIEKVIRSLVFQISINKESVNKKSGRVSPQCAKVDIE